jgi:hypothetical protein
LKKEDDLKFSENVRRPPKKIMQLKQLKVKTMVVAPLRVILFHDIKNQEIAMFHCKDCIDNTSRRTEKFPLWLPAQEDDVNGVWHLDLLKFLKDGNIDWEAVATLVKINK